jgi:hypothetical protein
MGEEQQPLRQANGARVKLSKLATSARRGGNTRASNTDGKQDEEFNMDGEEDSERGRAIRRRRSYAKGWERQSNLPMHHNFPRVAQDFPAGPAIVRRPQHHSRSVGLAFELRAMRLERS